jgi:hypothetical protein
VPRWLRRLYNYLTGRARSPTIEERWNTKIKDRLK